MKDRSEILSLLAVATACIEQGEPERAAWRLADAGGLLRANLPQKPGDELIGRDIPSGRGYSLPVKTAAQAQDDERTVEVEVRSVYGNEMIYPANFAAERFAAISGKKTLSRTDLMNIQALGFVVREVLLSRDIGKSANASQARARTADRAAKVL